MFKEALASIMENHERLLARIQSWEESLAVDNGPRESQAIALLENLRHFFQTDLLAHLHGEEEEFFPVVEQLSHGVWKEAQLRKEHGELRQRIEDFKSSLTLALYVGAQTKQSLLWRLLAEARSLLVRLKTHVAFEHELVREMRGKGLFRLGAVPESSRGEKRVTGRTRKQPPFLTREERLHGHVS